MSPKKFDGVDMAPLEANTPIDDIQEEPNDTTVEVNTSMKDIMEIPSKKYVNIQFS